MREGWKTKRMSEVFNLQMGKTPSRENPLYWNGRETWVSIGDLGFSKYISTSKECITKRAVAETGIKISPKGSVLMSFKLSVGKTAIAATDLYSNEAIMSFNPKEGFLLSPEYVYYYLKEYKWDGLNRAVMGFTLNKNTISQGVFSYPPLEEQERIVAELDLLTGVIEKQKAQLKELDNLAQSIFYDMFGDPVENEKGWEECIFKDAFKLKSGDNLVEKNFREGQYPVYGGNGISGYHNKFNKDGQFILIGRVGAYCGNVRYVQGHFWLTDNAFQASFDKEIFDYEYSCMLLNLIDLHQYANHAAQPVISNVGLRDIKIIIPPLQLQQQFAEKIEAIEHQKTLIKKSIEETQKLFDYTMDKYFG